MVKTRPTIILGSNASKTKQAFNSIIPLTTIMNEIVSDKNNNPIFVVIFIIL